MVYLLFQNSTDVYLYFYYQKSLLNYPSLTGGLPFLGVAPLLMFINQ